MAERDQNGQIPGDIQQAKNTRMGSQQVTETTNAQGNRSFSGRGGVQSGIPKPVKTSTPGPARTGLVMPSAGTAASGGGGGAGGVNDDGIMAGVEQVAKWPKPDDISRAMSTQPQNYPGTRVTETVNEQGNRSFSGNTARPRQNQIDSGLAMAGVGYNKPAGQRLNEGVVDPIANMLTYRPGMDPYGSDSKQPQPAAQQQTTQQKPKPQTVAREQGSFTVIPEADKAGAFTQADAAKVQQQQAAEDARKPVIGADGITRGLNDQNNRSFSGSNIAEFTPNDTTRTQDMSGYVKQANAGFERAIAAGDYETALQMANRSDASQMTRLGQLQGNIRSRREQELAASKAGGGIDQGVQQTAQRMLERAEYLAQNNSSKAAQRLSSEARALLGLGGGGSGAVPVSPLTEGIDTAASLAQQQAQADTAGLTAEQARTSQQEQQELQGILQGLNDPNLEPQQRQSLLQRYSAMQGGKNYVETERVVGFNGDGAPIMAKVQIDPITGQTMGGIDEYRSSLAAAMGGIQQNQDAAPGIANNFTNLWGRNLQIEEKK